MHHPVIGLVYGRCQVEDRQEGGRPRVLAGHPRLTNHETTVRALCLYHATHRFCKGLCTRFGNALLHHGPAARKGQMKGPPGGVGRCVSHRAIRHGTPDGRFYRSKCWTAVRHTDNTTRAAHSDESQAEDGHLEAEPVFSPAGSSTTPTPVDRPNPECTLRQLPNHDRAKSEDQIAGGDSRWILCLISTSRYPSPNQ